MRMPITRAVFGKSLPLYKYLKTLFSSSDFVRFVPGGGLTPNIYNRNMVKIAEATMSISEVAIPLTATGGRDSMKFSDTGNHGSYWQYNYWAAPDVRIYGVAPSLLPSCSIGFSIMLRNEPWVYSMSGAIFKGTCGTEGVTFTETDTISIDSSGTLTFTIWDRLVGQFHQYQNIVATHQLKEGVPYRVWIRFVGSACNISINGETDSTHVLARLTSFPHMSGRTFDPDVGDSPNSEVFRTSSHLVSNDTACNLSDFVITSKYITDADVYLDFLLSRDSSLKKLPVELRSKVAFRTDADELAKVDPTYLSVSNGFGYRNSRVASYSRRFIPSEQRWHDSDEWCMILEFSMTDSVVTPLPLICISQVSANVFMETPCHILELGADYKVRWARNTSHADGTITWSYTSWSVGSLQPNQINRIAIARHLDRLGPYTLGSFDIGLVINGRLEKLVDGSQGSFDLTPVGATGGSVFLGIFGLHHVSTSLHNVGTTIPSSPYSTSGLKLYSFHALRGSLTFSEMITAACAKVNTRGDLYELSVINAGSRIYLSGGSELYHGFDQFGNGAKQKNVDTKVGVWTIHAWGVENLQYDRYNHRPVEPSLIGDGIASFRPWVGTNYGGGRLFNKTGSFPASTNINRMGFDFIFTIDSTSASGWQYLVDVQDSDSFYGLVLRVTRDGQIDIAKRNNTVWSKSGVSFSFDTPMHMAVKANSAGDINVLLNGNLQIPDSVNDTTPDSSGSYFRIALGMYNMTPGGNYLGYGSFYHQGAMQHFAYYDNPDKLTAGLISTHIALMNNQIPFREF